MNSADQTNNVNKTTNSATEINGVQRDNKIAAASGIGFIASEQLNLLTAVGGWRGIIESVVPTLLFLVLYVVMGDYIIPAIITLGMCILPIVIRLLQRISPAPAISGLLAMLLSVFLAWRTGEASNIFLFGILVNAVYAVVLLLSVLFKYPLFGVIIGFIKGESLAWRKELRLRELKVVYYQITLLWIAVFTLRLIVQVPIYFAHNVSLLGVTKIAMGLPLFAVALWFSWALYHSVTIARVNAENMAEVDVNISADSDV